jgi:hypothetical protein
MKGRINMMSISEGDKPVCAALLQPPGVYEGMPFDAIARRLKISRRFLKSKLADQLQRMKRSCLVNEANGRYYPSGRLFVENTFRKNTPGECPLA